MSDYSDYNKKRMKLNELLPSVYRSEFNNSLFENTFNRFFTKHETQIASGYVGRSTNKTVQSRQIIEPSVHRQAFQLQPLITALNGTVESVYSWKDILNRLEQAGVDIEQLQSWGSVDQFNFAPPIDFDKLINYRNYFWVDPNSQPQYITIRNRCTVAEANLSFWKSVITEYGESFQVVDIRSSSETADYDQFVVAGNYEKLFVKDFPLYVNHSTNTSINQQTFSVRESYYFNNETVITVTTNFNDSTVSGVIDLTERLSELQSEVDCQCAGSAGWDTLAWDDNPSEPLWDGDFDTLLSVISTENPVDTVDPDCYSIGLWYKPSTDTLYQLDETTNDWKVVQTNFSTVEITGKALWDMSPNCGIKSIIDPADQWINQNKWLHKTDVTNFSTAKQAQMPIIEFEWDLELNEWTFTKHKWKYRADNLVQWTVVDEEPYVCELVPITEWEYYQPVDLLTMEIIIDERYGDLTGFFIPGSMFNIYDVPGVLNVEYALYKAPQDGACLRTHLICAYDANIATTLSLGIDPNVQYIFPSKTSKGDLWRGTPTNPSESYNINNQWLYDGVDYVAPICHVPYNHLAVPSIDVEIEPGKIRRINYNGEESNAVDIWNGSNYEFIFTTFNLLYTTRPNSTRARYGFNDVKVYINNVLQEGNYVETDSGGFVSGILFDANVSMNDFDDVRVTIGPEGIADIGREDLYVQTNTGQQRLSLIRYRKTSQPKFKTNQYPLFDLYDASGTSIQQVSQIFSFAVDSSYPINSLVQERIVVDATSSNYTFEQHLVDDDRLLSYRDYNRQVEDFWFDTKTNVLNVWDDLGNCWSTKQFTNNVLITPIVSSSQPLSPWNTVDGLLWFSPLTRELRQRNVSGDSWDIITGVVIADVDPTLTTIWKNNPERPYIPQKVDWEGRTLDEYNSQKQTYINSRVNELFVEDSTRSYEDMVDQAAQEWYSSQTNSHSSTGEWVGDWEIHDALYFNSQNETRPTLTSRELLTHFTSIMEAQPLVPGFSGINTSMFRLIPLNSVDIGLGGTIKQFNKQFTNFVSSIFIGTPSFEQVITFAKSQYDSLLNNIVERSKEYLPSVLIDNVDKPNIEEFLFAEVMQRQASNGFYSSVYHDSSVRSVANWIATLPIFSLEQNATPVHVIDSNLNANFVIHHDQHFDAYNQQPIVTRTLSNKLVEMYDIRTNSNLGIKSNTQPPQFVNDFATSYGYSVEQKNGALWLDTSTETLYRLTLDFISVSTPIAPSEGNLWFNTTDETLYYFTGTTWVAVHAPNTLYGTTELGSYTSAWKVFDINTILSTMIMNIENSLSDECVSNVQRFDPLTLKEDNTTLWMDIEEQYFKQYTIDNGIRGALLNDDYVISDSFTWNYKDGVPSLFPRPDVSPTITGCWQNVYEILYGTSLPHIEPWKLQGYSSKPQWWDEQYKDTTNVRRWKQTAGVGMWTNILLGLIPAGATYPNGIVSVTGDFNSEPSHVNAPDMPQYNYIPVNISESDVIAGTLSYVPDSLFPPYFNFETMYSVYNPSLGYVNTPIRSVFKSDTPIPYPSQDYVYGEGGTQEFLWKHNIEFNYTKLLIAYRMDPIETFHRTFGIPMWTNGNLEIDALTGKSVSHDDITFHGSVVNTNEVFNALGVNQWYVNYCRYNGFDLNASHVATLWKQWTAKLSYQLSSFVETQTFNVSHKNVELTELDYTFVSKKVPNVEEFWLHSFDASILEFPATYLRYSSQADWKFELNVVVNQNNTVTYYDVHRYQFAVDVPNNRCHLYTYVITNLSDNSLVVSGDQSEIFSDISSLTVFGSSSNDGTYTITDVFYDTNTKQTEIRTAEAFVNPLDITGFVKANGYRQLPWQTGDIIDLATDGVIPQPVYANKQYFIIVIDATTFQLARTQTDALTNVPIVLTSAGSRNAYVGTKSGSFVIKDQKNNNETWYTYAIDKSKTKTFTAPHQFYGIQNLIDLITGYDVYTYDEGWRINHSQIYRDFKTNRSINWNFELEDFIDFAFFERNARTAQNQQSFAVTFNDSMEVFEFVDYTSQHVTGDSIVFTSVDGPTPNGIQQHITYYMIRLTDSTFKIATSARDARSGIAVTGISTALGQGVVSISTPKRKRAATPHKFINPIREGVWFAASRGIVSDLSANVDNFGKHNLFSQTGMPIKRSNIYTYRQDILTHVNVTSENLNDLLASARLTIDYYEHAIQFNDYTVSDQYVYDPFIGLNISKIELDFERQISNTQRPSIGGYVLTVDKHNKKSMIRNIEGNIDDLRYAYDHTQNRFNPFVEQAQKSLGYYVKESTSLDSLNISPRSQFEFWKGMIQYKGSLNCISAFVNSKRFVDAKVDEFWAVKIAEYGTYNEKEYLELKLFTEDSISNDLRFHFIPNGSQPTSGFIGISSDDATRWFEQPIQRQKLSDNADLMYFSAKTTSTYVVENPTAGLMQHDLDTSNIVCTLTDNTGNISIIAPAIVNNNVIEIATNYTGTFTVIGFEIDEGAHNPLVVVDTISQTKVANIIFWNPKKNLHDNTAYSCVDVVSGRDPAGYTSTPSQVNDYTDDGSTVESLISKWNQNQVGTTWLDTARVGYVPYDDPSIFLSVEDRLKSWGKLSEWATIDVSEWVDSEVPPNEWDDLAAAEAGDNTIDESIRKSGTAVKWLFRKNGSSLWYVMRPSIMHGYVCVNGSTIFNISIMDDVRTGDTIQVYVNGSYIDAFEYTPSFDVSTIYPSIQANDYVSFVREIPSDPEVIAALVESGDYLYDYQYTTTIQYDQYSNQSTRYFFWVSNKTTRTSHPVSCATINQTLSLPNIPYVVPCNFETQTVDLPNRITQVVICGLQGIIRDDNRYILSITKDFTLRDNLDENDSVSNIKHEEWKMFRQEQQFNIDKWMWDRITEAIIGYKLSDSSIRVPSYQFELYDAQFQTDTRFGLEEGQAFVDGETAKVTVQTYLNDPNIDFYPVDIGLFLDSNNFDTDENTIQTMEKIYNTFAYTHVNRIFFSVLLDALSNKRKYPGLLKTSMVALHGIKPFQVGGIFDD